MNERIKELAEQAGYDIKPFYKGEDNFQTPHFKDEKLEKFAELIVQECMLAVSKTPVSDDEVSTMVRCHDQIEKHFGVEE